MKQHLRHSQTERAAEFAEDKSNMVISRTAYTTRNGYYYYHAGKLTSTERQMGFLKAGAVRCHCRGGIAMADHDLQKLIKKGYMKFFRIAYSKGWGGDYDLRRTEARITPAGEAFRDR